MLNSLMSFFKGSEEVPQVDTHWISESGIIDVFVMLGPKPHDLFQEYAAFTGTTALPPVSLASLFYLALYQFSQLSQMISNFLFKFLFENSVWDRFYKLISWPWLLNGWITLTDKWIAIQRIGVNKTYCAIHLIEIYPRNNVIHSSINWGLVYSESLD